MGTNDINASGSSCSNQALRLIIRELEEAKAYDICQLDVRNLTDITDFMVIANGTSHRHVHALAERVREAARQKQVRLIGIEGEVENDWILMDYLDCVLHVLVPEMRDRYRLEQIWGEAPRLDLDAA